MIGIDDPRRRQLTGRDSEHLCMSWIFLIVCKPWRFEEISRDNPMQLVGMVVSDYPSNPWDCIFTYIHHNQPKVGKYTNPMDPVDYSIFGLFNKIISLSLSFSFFCIPFFSGFLGYSLPKKHQSYTTRPPISLTLKNPEYQRMQTKHYKQH